MRPNQSGHQTPDQQTNGEASLVLPVPAKSRWPVVVTLAVASPGVVLTGAFAGWPAGLVVLGGALTMLSCVWWRRLDGPVATAAYLCIAPGALAAKPACIMLLDRRRHQVGPLEVQRSFASPWSVSWSGRCVPVHAKSGALPRRYTRITVFRTGINERQWRQVMRWHRASRFPAGAHPSAGVAQK